MVAAATWLDAGGRLGVRGIYVAPGTVVSLREELCEGGLEPAWLDAGLVDVVPTDAAYDLSVPIDGVAQLAFYSAVLDATIAAGFRGLRVAADITPLVAEPSRRRPHLAWEQLADRYISEHALSPICLYDARAVGGIDAIVSSHPLRGPGATPFALFGCGPEHASLEGEVDALGAPVFAELLESMPRGDRQLDLGGLRFIDGRGADLLHGELGRRRALGQPIAVRSAPRLLRALWSLCEFDPSLLCA